VVARAEIAVERCVLPVMIVLFPCWGPAVYLGCWDDSQGVLSGR
jgi:hypothetical protein